VAMVLAVRVFGWALDAVLLGLHGSARLGQSLSYLSGNGNLARVLRR
jgi:hypothetical protein